MKQMLKKFFCITILLSMGSAYAAYSKVAGYFPTRSQSRNAARELAGWTQHTNLFEMEKFYGSFSVTPEYTRSFKSDRIARCLFGGTGNCNGTGSCDDCDECPVYTIKGSTVAGRDTNKDWLADWFYLPSDFEGTISFKPRVQNFLVDFNLYLGLDEWADGLYFNIYAPITWTKWELNCCENVIKAGTATGFAGATALKSFLEYASQGKAPAPVTTGPNINFTPLQCAKICGCDETETRLADLRAEFGWNFAQDYDYHFGLFLELAAPTGNEVRSDYVFAPMVGNGKHWEFGGGLGAHYTFWRNEDETRSFGFYLDAHLTHMFKKRQNRIADLKNGGGLSRYTLAAKGDFANGTTTEVKPVADLLCCCPVKVSVGVQADIVAMFNYTSGNFGWDFGYNFWGKSCDKISCDDDCDDCCNASCDSKTSCGCEGFDGKTWWIPQAITNDNQSLGGINGSITNYATAADTTKTYLDQTHIEYARTKGQSHKLFTHLSYNWMDREDWIPYIGVGGEVEFGKKGDNCCDTNCGTSSTSCDDSCDTCLDCTSLSQWGVWVKGGVSWW